MIQRADGPQCLSSRVSALADGSLPDDVRDRALAHVTSCPDCRADLDAERLLVARLQSLPAPRPSSSLVAALLAMGEPGGPMPPRPGHVPGMPRPRPATIRREPDVDPAWHGVPTLPWHRVTPGRRSTSRSAGLPARPGPTSRPGSRGTTRRRVVVGATAGAVGAGVIAAALASGLQVAPQVAPSGQPHLEASAVATRISPGQQAVAGGFIGIEAVLTTPAHTWRPSGPVSARSSGSAAAVPVTTTLLRHLLAPARDGGARGVAQGGSLASDSYLSFSHLAGPSR
jgi:hypothetical protein